jgi:SAM-dependent methyltransferase
MPAAKETTYAFVNARAVQRERLRALEAVLDPGSTRHLDALGIERGWTCLEVGAGGGSVAAWLCDRVGPDGAVVATDLDTTLLRDLARSNLEVRTHDVLADTLPGAGFDLVHVRLLLAWLGDPQTALRRLIAALKPGGVLLAEEMDFGSLAADTRLDAVTQALFARVVAAHHAVLARRHSFDVGYGRRLAGDLADAGLTEIACEGRASMWTGGSAGGTVWRLTLTQLHDAIATSGLATADDVDRAIELCGDPRFSLLSPVTVAAWGRRAA